jgi:hypothetical protein
MARSKQAIIAAVAVVMLIVVFLLAWDFLVINFIKSGTVETPP